MKTIGDSKDKTELTVVSTRQVDESKGQTAQMIADMVVKRLVCDGMLHWPAIKKWDEFDKMDWRRRATAAREFYCKTVEVKTPGLHHA